MARLIALDSGPLWLLGLRRGKPEADACRQWARGMEAAGATFLIPEIALYEVRREFILRGMTHGLVRLDTLRGLSLFLPITSAALERAAEFWAVVRKAGGPTASPGELDGDAILAAQATLATGSADTLTVATTNVGHLSRFPGIDAKEWGTIA